MEQLAGLVRLFTGGKGSQELEAVKAGPGPGCSAVLLEQVAGHTC